MTPIGAAAGDQRDVEAGLGADRPRRVLVDLGIVGERVDALGLPALEHATALRAGALELQAEELLGAVTVGRLDPQASRPARGQRDRHHARSDQAAQAPADQLQEPRQLDLARQRRRRPR